MFKADMEAWAVSLHPAHFHLKPCADAWQFLSVTIWAVDIESAFYFCFLKATDIIIQTELHFIQKATTTNSQGKKIYIF